MAKDDYFVLAYRLLAYLYACLKEGAPPDLSYIKHGTDAFPVGEAYWNYLLMHLSEDGYIEGVTLVPVMGHITKGVRVSPNLNITPKGIEYLQDNSTMQKAKSFLKDLKEILPGI